MSDDAVGDLQDSPYRELNPAMKDLITEDLYRLLDAEIARPNPRQSVLRRGIQRIIALEAKSLRTRLFVKYLLNNHGAWK